MTIMEVHFCVLVKCETRQEYLFRVFDNGMPVPRVGDVVSDVMDASDDFDDEWTVERVQWYPSRGYVEVWLEDAGVDSDDYDAFLANCKASGFEVDDAFGVYADRQQPAKGA